MNSFENFFLIKKYHLTANSIKWMARSENIEVEHLM